VVLVSEPSWQPEVCTLGQQGSGAQVQETETMCVLPDASATRAANHLFAVSHIECRDRFSKCIAWVCRDAYQDQLQGLTHHFRIVVHSDSSAPVLEFGQSYGTLQVSLL